MNNSILNQKNQRFHKLTQWSFFAFLLTTTFFVRKVIIFHSIGGEFNEYSGIFVYLSDLFLIATLVFFALQNKINKSSRNLVQNFNWRSFALIIFLLWIILSIFWSPIKDIAFFRTIKIIIFAGLFLFAKSFVSRETILKSTTKILIFLGLFEAAVGIAQFTLQHSLGLNHILGESNLSPDTPGVAKVILVGEKFIRAYGTFPHPNVLSGFLLITIILTFTYNKMFHVERNLLDPSSVRCSTKEDNHCEVFEPRKSTYCGKFAFFYLKKGHISHIVHVKHYFSLLDNLPSKTVRFLMVLILALYLAFFDNLDIVTSTFWRYFLNIFVIAVFIVFFYRKHTKHNVSHETFFFPLFSQNLASKFSKTNILNTLKKPIFASWIIIFTLFSLYIWHIKPKMGLNMMHSTFWRQHLGANIDFSLSIGILSLGLIFYVGFFLRSYIKKFHVEQFAQKFMTHSLTIRNQWFGNFDNDRNSDISILSSNYFQNTKNQNLFHMEQVFTGLKNISLKTERFLRIWFSGLNKALCLKPVLINTKCSTRFLSQNVPYETQNLLLIKGDLQSVPLKIGFKKALFHAETFGDLKIYFIALLCGLTTLVIGFRVKNLLYTSIFLGYWLFLFSCFALIFFITTQKVIFSYPQMFHTEHLQKKLKFLWLKKAISSFQNYLRNIGFFKAFFPVKEISLHKNSRLFHMEQVFAGLKNIPLKTAWFLGIQILGLLLTFSKSAIIGIIICSTYILYKNVPHGTTFLTLLRQILLFPMAFFSQKNTVLRRKVILIMLIILIGIVLIRPDFNALFVQSLQERYFYLNVSRETIGQNILKGLGIGQFVVNMDKYTPQPLESWRHQPVHNVFLLIWSELGIVGLVLWIWFLWKLFHPSRNVPHGTSYGVSVENKNQQYAPMTIFKGIMFGFLFIMLFDHYLWDIQQGQIMFWLIAGIWAGLKERYY